MRPWAGFGTKSRPGRLQEAPGTIRCGRRVTKLAKITFQGAILEPSGVPKSIKNRICGFKSAQAPSKNDLWEGGWKKHEKSMKTQCFLMAWNHVWRYTLRLFYTFGLFETYRKIDANSVAFLSCFW